VYNITQALFTHDASKEIHKQVVSQDLWCVSIHSLVQ